MLRTALLALLALAAGGPAAGASPADASAGLFAERAALLAIDAKCALLNKSVRAALTATMIQARGGAYRQGWSDARLDGVSRRAADAGRARDCHDPLVVQAVGRATAGFAGWSHMQAIELPGVERAWRARRTPDPGGWLLVQQAGAAQFGLRAVDGRITTSVVAPLAGAGGPPASALVYFRDRARAPRPFLDVPGLAATSGLAAGAAPRALAASVIASAISVERSKTAPARIKIEFPPALLGELAALDPRESAEIVISAPGAPARLFYVEIGDLAVARAFLAAAPL